MNLLNALFLGVFVSLRLKLKKIQRKGTKVLFIPIPILLPKLCKGR